MVENIKSEEAAKSELTFAITEGESSNQAYCLNILGSMLTSTTYEGALRLCENMAGPILATALKSGYTVSAECVYPSCLDGKDFAEVIVPAVIDERALRYSDMAAPSGVVKKIGTK